MSKDLSSKYYQNNKEMLPKMLQKDIKAFLKKEKIQKIYQKMKNKCLLSIEKKIIK